MFYGKTNKETKPKPKPSREAWLSLKGHGGGQDLGIDGMNGGMAETAVVHWQQKINLISEEPNKQNTK